MEAHRRAFGLVACVSAALLLLKREAVSQPYETPLSHHVTSDALSCQDDFMSVYIPKLHFADLPLTIYVQDEHGGYYQAIAIAKRCQYFLGESEAFIILTVASHGCFVRQQKHGINLTVVIVAPADAGTVEIVKSMLLFCGRRPEAEGNKTAQPLASGRSSCSKDGFHFSVHQDAVPPLDLDSVWIPSSRNLSCRPKTRSEDAVTFSFPFTDCGTQYVVADGVVTFWVNVEVKHRPHKGSVFHDAPLRHTVLCSFAASHITQLGIKVQRGKPEYLSTLKSEGKVTAEMRFAKDSSYTSFFSSRDPLAVTELGQPVHVEVSVLKHEDDDLVLLLDDCWATPTDDPHDAQRWNLLVKGCPFSGDTHSTVVLPVVSKELKYPSLHKWFVVKLFSFVKPSTFENLVYFHCDIEICKKPGCLQSCSNGRRKLRLITSGSGQRIFHSVVSSAHFLYLL